MPDQPTPTAVSTLEPPGPTGNNTRAIVGSVGSSTIVGAAIALHAAGATDLIIAVVVISLTVVTAGVIIGDSIRPMRKPKPVA